MRLKDIAFLICLSISILRVQSFVPCCDSGIVQSLVDEQKEIETAEKILEERRRVVNDAIAKGWTLPIAHTDGGVVKEYQVQDDDNQTLPLYSASYELNGTHFCGFRHHNYTIHLKMDITEVEKTSDMTKLTDAFLNVLEISGSEWFHIRVRIIELSLHDGNNKSVLDEEKARQALNNNFDFRLYRYDLIPDQYKNKTEKKEDQPIFVIQSQTDVPPVLNTFRDFLNELFNFPNLERKSFMCNLNEPEVLLEEWICGSGTDRYEYLYLKDNYGPNKTEREMINIDLLMSSFSNEMICPGKYFGRRPDAIFQRQTWRFDVDYPSFFTMERTQSRSFHTPKYQGYEHTFQEGATSTYLGWQYPTYEEHLVSKSEFTFERLHSVFSHPSRPNHLSANHLDVIEARKYSRCADQNQARMDHYDSLPRRIYRPIPRLRNCPIAPDR